jgi:hypothetical protein
MKIKPILSTMLGNHYPKQKKSPQRPLKCVKKKYKRVEEINLGGLIDVAV